MTEVDARARDVGLCSCQRSARCSPCCSPRELRGGLDAIGLIDELWGRVALVECDEGSVQNSDVSKLRRLLGEGVLIQRARLGELGVPGELDLDRFDDLVAEGRRAIALAAGDPEPAAAVLAEALALWRGPPLADLTYEPFASADIERLDGLRVAALIERFDADLQLGRHDALIGELEGLVARYPLQERLRGQLMLALYRCGRQADALRVYKETRRVLVDELGIEPRSWRRDSGSAAILVGCGDPGHPRRRRQGDHRRVV